MILVNVCFARMILLNDKDCICFLIVSLKIVGTLDILFLMLKSNNAYKSLW